MALTLAAAALAFIAVSTVALGLFGYGPGSRAAEDRLRSWLRTPRRPAAMQAGQVLRRQTTSLPGLSSFLSESAWTTRAALDLQRSGLNLRVSEYLLLRLVVAAAAGTLTLLIVGGTVGFLAAFPAAAAGFMLPAIYVHVRGQRRAAALGQQLVEALELIANALRSGFAFAQAVEMAGSQLSPPIRDELEHFLKDTGLGERMDDALRAMVTRTGSYDLDMAVTAILVQRTTGGNLAEVLDRVADTMRERDRVQREVRALTAHQRLTGLILSGYPVVLALILFVLSPSHMSILWTDPLGRIALALAVALQLIGVYTIRRILTLDY